MPFSGLALKIQQPILDAFHSRVQRQHRQLSSPSRLPDRANAALPAIPSWVEALVIVRSKNVLCFEQPL